MIYPHDFEHKIDFTIIRENLRQKCDFSIGRERVDALQFLTNAEAIKHLIATTQEMLTILQDSSIDYPQGEMYDLRERLSRIRIEGLFLDEQELFQLRKSLDVVVQYISFFTNLDKERFPYLTSPTAFPVLGDSATSSVYKIVVTKIDTLLDKYGNLRDNASPELARIRKELKLSQGSVSKALSSILRQAQADGLVDKDVTPTLREGRLVIPVPPMYKRKIGGIVHDESATGKTVFIEPQQVVEANNRIRELEGDERRERIRILIAFADTLREHIPTIQSAQELLGDIDFLHAKALLAKELNAIAPQVQNQPMVDWREAYHPILLLNFRKQNKTVVPLTIQLSKENRILIISGPNAGGKSVCLKTVALLQYMLQCGLLVPLREDSTMGIFRDLLIDIGDQQSIEDDLSTYSSHLRNMKMFLKVAEQAASSPKRAGVVDDAEQIFPPVGGIRGGLLLLIDEFGGGTEPAIGGAIAQAVLLNLNQKEAYGVITTHYGNLKHLAEDTPGLINGAMLYDRGQLRPLFQLSMGQPGSSFAIEIARQIGLPEQIIAEATDIVGSEQIDYDKHLQDIARDKRYWENKRQQIRQKEKRLEERMAHYEEEIAGLKAKKKELLNEAKEEAAQLLQQSNATIERTIRQIKEAKADKEKTKAARKRLEDFKQQVETSDAPSPQRKRSKDSMHGVSLRDHAVETSIGRSPWGVSPKGQAPASRTPHSALLTLGTRVKKKGTNMVGEILSLTDKQAVVAFGNLQSTVALKDLEYISARQAKKTSSSPHSALLTPHSATSSNVLHNRKLSFARELDLRGMRADDALIELMNYMDDAIMVNAEEVRILHGTGTGALRQAVRGYLQSLRNIHAFHDAHPAEGGAGITIVEI